MVHLHTAPSRPEGGVFNTTTSNLSTAAGRPARLQPCRQCQGPYHEGAPLPDTDCFKTVKVNGCTRCRSAAVELEFLLSRWCGLTVCKGPVGKMVPEGTAAPSFVAGIRCVCMCRTRDLANHQHAHGLRMMHGMQHAFAMFAGCVVWSQWHWLSLEQANACSQSAICCVVSSLAGAAVGFPS